MADDEASNAPGAHGEDAAADEETEEKTFVYNSPIFPAGYAAGPQDRQRILAAANADQKGTVAVTGQERFEHMLLYCLTLLQRAKGNICAFYLDDFPDCGEFNMRVLQQLIGRSGYVTSDFREHATSKYKGFWAWQAKG